MTSRPERGEWLFLIAATALALALRWLGVGHESIWYDEAFTLKTAAAPVLDELTTRAADPGNPSLYFLLIHFWQMAFGSSIESARMFTGLTGALSVFAVWLLGREMQLPNRCCQIAMLMTAVSPPLVYLGQEARCFALFATVATLTLWCAVRIGHFASIAKSANAPQSQSIVEKLKHTLREMFVGPDRAIWILFLVLATALIHIHYYAFFVLTAIGLYLLLLTWSSGQPRLLQLLVAFSILILLFLPWLPIFLWQLKQGAQRSADSWWQHAAMMPMFSAVGRTLIWRQHGNALVGLLALVVTTCYVIPFAGLWKERTLFKPDLFFVAATMAIVIFVSSFVTPMIHSHYLSVVFPVFYLVLARGFYAAWQNQLRFTRLSATVLMVLVGCSLLGLYIGRHKHDWRGVANAIHETAPTLPVFCYEDLGGLPLGYYQRRLANEAAGEVASSTLITKVYGPDGSSWQTPEILGEMDLAKKGFWFVLYETYPTTRQEAPALKDFLTHRYQLETVIERPAITAMLLRPRQSIAPRSADE